MAAIYVFDEGNGVSCRLKMWFYSVPSLFAGGVTPETCMRTDCSCANGSLLFSN
jgi:hypothetical protein